MLEQGSSRAGFPQPRHDQSRRLTASYLHLSHPPLPFSSPQPLGSRDPENLARLATSSAQNLTRDWSGWALVRRLTGAESTSELIQVVCRVQVPVVVGQRAQRLAGCWLEVVLSSLRPPKALEAVSCSRPCVCLSRSAHSIKSARRTSLALHVSKTHTHAHTHTHPLP